VNRPITAAIGIPLLLMLSACRGAAGPVLPNAQGVPPNLSSVVMTKLRPGVAPWSRKIKHIVIIFQENRTTDNLFNGYPGADTQSWGLDHKGRRIPLIQVSQIAPYDVSHRHSSFEIEYAGGKMNGFDLVGSSRCGGSAGACPPLNRRAYGVVPRIESKPYWEMAHEWVLADRMFETNQGPSFPAHQYIVSGTSTNKNGSPLRAADNPRTRSGGHAGGCDSPADSLVALIDPGGVIGKRVYPCFERLSLTDLLDAKGVGWHFYQNDYKPGLWAALDAIRHIRNKPAYKTEVLAPSSRILDDIKNGDLARVSWVMPSAKDSDHAKVTDGSGPSWVASIVNAVGTSRYWSDTAIFVTWDDWGGWYDHVKPPQYNSYELGFRVPLLVISPYAKQGHVSHKQHEFGSILKFIEETYGLGSLNTTDVRSDDLTDCFDFNQAPRTFHRIGAPYGEQYFLNQAPSDVNPDDDF
jgi:phospholipase C